MNGSQKAFNADRCVRNLLAWLAPNGYLTHDNLHALVSRLTLLRSTPYLPTDHAIVRFMERLPTHSEPLKSLCKLFKRAKEIRPKPATAVCRLINHGRQARYFRSDEVVFVVEGDRIVTVETIDLWRAER
jgi:hypothetical protein